MTEVLFNPHNLADSSNELEQQYELDREHIFKLGELATLEAVVTNQQWKRPFNIGEFPADQPANID